MHEKSEHPRPQNIITWMRIKMEILFMPKDENLIKAVNRAYVVTATSEWQQEGAVIDFLKVPDGAVI